MKRFVVLSVCLLLALAASASATVLPVCQVIDGGLTISATVDTTSNPGYDIVDIYVTGVPVGQTSINAMQGTWTAWNPAGVGADLYVKNAAPSTSTFKNATTTSGIGTDSAVNFETAGPGVWNRDGLSTSHLSTFISGGWYTTNINNNLLPGDGSIVNTDGFPTNLLAEMIVTDATTQVRFNSWTVPTELDCGFSWNTGTVHTTDFIVGAPEPSTLVLLGCGLFGLLAYAWRKRK